MYSGSFCAFWTGFRELDSFHEASIDIKGKLEFRHCNEHLQGMIGSLMT